MFQCENCGGVVKGFQFPLLGSGIKAGTEAKKSLVFFQFPLLGSSFDEVAEAWKKAFLNFQFPLLGSIRIGD